MSTPTLASWISSSTSRLRSVPLKKTRPPASSATRRLLRGLHVPPGIHAAWNAIPLQRVLVLFADVRVFHPVGDRSAAFGDVHAGVVDRLLSRHARVAPGVVRAEPGGEAQGVLRPAEMLVVP